MALLDMMVKHNYQLVVVHVNYHFRSDSDIDEKLVRDYCALHHLECYVRQGDKSDYANGNFEMMAREMRYAFYEETGEKLHIDHVILAHHFDDVVETIIMQLQRHNNHGYLGIKEVSFVHNMHVIRPLLHVRKEDLKQYCQQNRVVYHDDYTNADTSYTRNRIRHEEIVHYDIDRLYQQAQEHNQRYLQKLDRLAPVFSQYDQLGFLKLSDIDSDDLQDVIYHMLKKAVYPPYISQNLIDEVMRQLSSKKPNIEMNLPVNAVFIKEYDNIRVGKKSADDHYCDVYDRPVLVKTPYYEVKDDGHIHDGVFLKTEDFPVTIRNFLPGDTIKTSGGTKKVARLFIDRKVSKAERKYWPILLNSKNEIILIPHIAKNIEYLYTKPNIFVVKLDTSK